MVTRPAQQTVVCDGNDGPTATEAMAVAVAAVAAAAVGVVMVAAVDGVCMIVYRMKYE